MYIIIDKTAKTSTTIEGDYPLTMMEFLIAIGHDVEIISTYSNTLKYNFHFECEYGDHELVCDEITFNLNK